MNDTAFDRLREHWREQGLAWKDGPNGTATAQAPGHSPVDRSVTFRRIDGMVLMHSHSDDKGVVLEALGLTTKDLFDDPAGVSYRYPDGRTVFRSPHKKFRQSGNTKGAALYRSERLAEHQTGIPVYVVEGEKDVHALESVGAVAVCSAMGAGKAHLFDWTPLTGHTVVVVADNDAHGRKHALQAYEIVEPIAAGVAIVTAKVGKDAADHVAAGHGLDEFEIIELRGATGRRIKVIRGSDVKLQRVRWVVEDWIPAGSLTLCAGREGLGKSTIGASLCAQITQGTLEGELHGTPHNVLYVHSEDSREFTVAPRLKAAGADMDRVLFVDVETAHTDSGTLILPLDTPELEKVIARHRVAFVVLDAATSSMSSELSGKDDRAVRQYLEPLAQLAARRGCVVFGLCHFGKRDGADTGKLILGSIAWSQVARSVLSVARDDETGHLVVTNTKANLAPRIRSMEAEIVSTAVQTEDGEAEVGVLRWLGETTRDARDLLSGPDDGDLDESDDAARWLREYLEASGRAKSADAKRAGITAGYSERTIQRARKKLKVHISDSGFPRVTYWSLPPKCSSSSRATTEGHAGTTGTTGTTGDDQGKQDGTTGADSQSCQSGVNGTTGGTTGNSADSAYFATPPGSAQNTNGHRPDGPPLCPECSLPLDGAAAGRELHGDCASKKARRESEQATAEERLI